MYSVLAPVALAVLALSRSTVAQDDDSNPCVSYGVDFQDGGSYFQNVTSTAPFTFVSIFEGCQDDVANNILVDPTGDEYECTDTNLTPSDTNMLSTCPIDKDQLTSGPWSIIIISNNGDADPIAYERDFNLTVGTPVTSTYTPTATISVTETPVVNTTTTYTSVTTFTNTVTVTSPARSKSSTTTKTPARVTTTTTRIMGTVKATDYTVIPNIITRTHTQTCSTPHHQPHPDPWARITPTLVTAAALTPTTSATSTPAARRRDNFRRVPVDRAQRIAERKARLANGLQKLSKRGLDNATTTVTDLNTSDYVTQTSFFTASASTMLITTEVTSSTTLSTTSTILTGTTTLPVVTITAATPTKTKTRFTVYTTTVSTITKSPKITVTITTAPASSTTVCLAKGGELV